jgi:hypothetical protein
MEHFVKSARTQTAHRPATHPALRLSVLVMAGLLLHCGDMRLAGSVSETTNGMATGRVVTAAGEPVGSAKVKLVPAGFDPVKDTAAILTDTTDADGRFYFPGIDSGDFSISAANGNNGISALRTGIRINCDTVDIAEMTLTMPGAVKVMLPEGINASDGYVYLPGTDIFAYLLGREDSLILTAVPAGGILPVAYSSLNSSAATMIRSSITTESNVTVTVFNPSWLYAKALSLNTTPAGANVANGVLHFPLLIRLTSSNFDFAQAKASGADIRFTKPNNTFLSYEIERWDSASAQAEIWVSMDTVHGNNNNQSLIMYWGNAAAGNRSNGSTVFDTGNGFVGVWHLNNAPAGDASIKDQTAHHHHGTPMGNFSDTDLVDGTIGKGLYFLGTDPTIYIGRGVKTGTVFTLGTWVYSTIYEPQRFICDQGGYSLRYDDVTKGFRLEFRDKSSWRGIPQDGGTVQPMTTGQWYYVTGTYDGDKARLYINGVLATASGSIGSAPVASTDSLLIGSARHLEHVKGIMDEVRIENTARSDDWIKLCYMNQKELDVLVKW